MSVADGDVPPAVAAERGGAVSGEGWSEADWKALLEERLGAPVRVRYGRARHQVVRVERRGRSSVLHLSGFFRAAPDEVREALVAWMRSGHRARRATRTLDLWIEARVRELAASDPRAPRLDPRGRFHDLAEIAADVLAGELAGELGPAVASLSIGWGRAKGSRPRRSLRLGSFDAIGRAIRIHPVLDSAAVERWFVRYVVHHELLHAALDSPRDAKGRRVHHGPVFRRRERAYADTERALAWEKRHIAALIRCARAGKPFEPAKRARAPREARRDESLVQRLLF
jgi:predicted metal-dependent hydrolase